jgi:hypothetical protein
MKLTMNNYIKSALWVLIIWVLIPSFLSAISVMYIFGADISIELMGGTLIGSSLGVIVMHVYSRKKSTKNADKDDVFPVSEENDIMDSDSEPQATHKTEPIVTYIGLLTDVSFFGDYFNPASCIKTNNGFVTVSGHVYAAPLNVPVFAVVEEDKFPIIRIEFGDNPRGYPVIRDNEFDDMMAHLAK